MSRVTIGDVYYGIYSRQTYEQQMEFRAIEIVPRKIVEMIIEKCEKDGATYLGPVGNEALDIKKYAESLLKQFEEEEE